MGQNFTKNVLKHPLMKFLDPLLSSSVAAKAGARSRSVRRTDRILRDADGEVDDFEIV